MKSKIKMFIYYIIVIIVGITLGVTLNKAVFQKNNKNESIISQVKETKDNFKNKGFGVEVYNEKGKLYNQYNLFFDDNYTFEFINNTDYNKEFNISFYLDYNQIKFNINNQDYYEYKVNVESKKNISLPFVYNLNSDNKAHLLKLVISDSSDSNSNWDHIISYNIIPNEYTHNFSPTKKNYDLYDKLVELNNFFGVKINKLSNDSAYDLNPIIVAKKGQNVEIPVLFGGYKNINNYLIWFTLNNKQYFFDNENNYEEFSVPVSKVAMKYIKLKTPNEIGEYVIQANVIGNPWDQIGIDSSDIVTNCSNKITLKVVQ